MIHAVRDLFSEIPVHQTDIYESNTTALLGRALLLALISILVAIPILSGRLLAVDELQFGPTSHNLPWTQTAETWRHWLTLPESPMGQTLLAMQQAMGLVGANLRWVSVVLSAFTSVLLWLVLRRLGMHAAWLAGALFAVQPLHIQTVAWVAQQPRLWAANFGLTAILLFLRACDVPQTPQELQVDPTLLDTFWLRLLWKVPWSCLLSLIMLSLAILCQPTAAVAGVIAVILVTWRRPMTPSLWVMSAFLLAIAVGGLAISASQNIGGFAAAGGLHKLVGTSVMTTKAAGLLAMRSILAWPMIQMRPAMTQVRDAIFYAVLIAWVAAFAICFFSRIQAARGLSVCIVIFVLLIPTVLPFAGDRARAQMPGIDAFGYVLCIPLVVLVAEALLELTKLLQPAEYVLAARIGLGGLLLCVLGIYCAASAAVYGSTERLLQRAIEDNPGNSAAQGHLVDWYIAHGDFAAAQSVLGSVSSTEPDVERLLAAGRIADAAGHAVEARVLFDRAVSRAPNDVDALTALAAASQKAGQLDRAQGLYQRASAIDPNNASIGNDLALVLLRNGQLSAARDILNQIVAKNPNFAPARVNLASVCFAQGRMAEAAEQLQAVARLDPENFQAFHNAGVMLYELKDDAGAEKMLLVAVQLKPDSAQARNDLGVAQCAQGEYDRAIYNFQQAISLQPDYADAAHNLEIARRRQSGAAQTRPNHITP